MTRRWQA